MPMRAQQRSQRPNSDDESDKAEEDARNPLLLGWARELLLESKA
jgi:hypothetical protein